MNVATIFLVAAVGGVFAFSRDIFKAWNEARKGRRDKQKETFKEPLETAAMVVADTAGAVALQSAVLVQVRLSLADSEKRRADAEARLEASEAKVKIMEAENMRLYLALGKAHAGE